MAVTAQATFCATLVDEWARGGVRHAVISPGSRSTPLALALAGDGRLDLHVFHDERAAAFAALGIGRTGMPAVLLCTSGTAASHFHAAVIEADLSEVPMLVCSADRPVELRDVGAPQVIDQRDLYGPSVRLFVDPGVADDAARYSWRPVAAQALATTTGPRPGPVHLNLPFREPLLGEAGELPAGRSASAPWTTMRPAPPTFAEIDAERLVAVGSSPSAVSSAHAPVLARVDTAGPAAIAHADLIVRHRVTAERLRPDVIVRSGGPLASRVVNDWLAASGAVEHVFARSWSDPSRTARTMTAGILPVCTTDEAYVRDWLEADSAAETAIADALGSLDGVTEPGVARSFVSALPPGAHAVIASSMPVRDVEWFAPRRADITVHSNRGANGIDGTIATAIGVATATSAPTAVLLGDIAFLHDSTALIGAQRREIDLSLVVIDNDGGGIFSFLPQAAALAAERFEALFGTSHGVSIEQLAAAHGIEACVVESPGELDSCIRASVGGGVRMVVVRTDRDVNVKVHDALNAAVRSALDAL